MLNAILGGKIELIALRGILDFTKDQFNITSWKIKMVKISIK